MTGNTRHTARRIRKLTREIEQIDRLFYGSRSDSDAELYSSMLEHKRDDRVRSVVLQLHTAIEQVLTSFIVCRLLNVKSHTRKRAERTVRGRALRRLLRGGIGFDGKLDLAVASGVLSGQTQRALKELNGLRNKCSHNWLLRMPVRRGIKPRQKKPPLLAYKGHDLHSVAVLQDFLKDFGGIYFRLYVRYLNECD